LRSATAAVDSIPLICASVMSKKLALGADCLLLDVKCGSGAFMKTREDADKLAGLMERVGNAAGKKTRAIVTDMSAPLGNAVGNALEVKEAIELLQGKITGGALYDTCIELTANMLELAGKGSLEQCSAMAKEAIASGKALSVLRATIALQGGDPNVCDDTSLLPAPRFSYTVKAAHDIEITAINAQEIGMVSLLLGAGRLAKEDRIDPTAGIVMECSVGDKISVDAPLMTLYSSFCSDFSEAAVRALNAVGYKDLGKVNNY
ncbi:MAG: thymidine phosphorylase, partial [Ruminococcus sp.]|nr:thymidine phosphorylase [Ruminococcus sp.]